VRLRTIGARALPGVLVFLFSSSPRVQAQTPGVDTATPRVAISTVGDTLVFSPANLVVEQFDFVAWHYAGTVTPHTTTSGGICGSPSGLWDAALNSTSTQFTRQFSDIPQVIPYQCTIHCLSNMRGQVTVTGPIDLDLADASGVLTLGWSGGSGVYNVIRSGAPGFPSGSGTVTLASGTAVTSLTDVAVPAVGQASYYLVMNHF
jgi:plastocyanin